MPARKPLSTRRDARRLSARIARDLDRLTDYMMIDRDVPRQPFETLVDASNVVYFFGRGYELGDNRTGR